MEETSRVGGEAFISSREGNLDQGNGPSALYVYRVLFQITKWFVS